MSTSTISKIKVLDGIKYIRTKVHDPKYATKISIFQKHITNINRTYRWIDGCLHLTGILFVCCFVTLRADPLYFS